MRIPGIPFHQGRNDYTDSDGRHYGIAIHNTSNTASDEGEASYADHRSDGTSSHFYVDGDSVIQSLDTDAKAGHAGSREGNENALAFEITGTNDKSRQWWLDNVAWGQLGYVIAYILQHDPDFAGFQVRRASVAEMQANPRVKAFYGHDDMRRAWGGTTHDDPGPNFPWDRLEEAVNAALNGDEMELTDKIPLTQTDTLVTGEVIQPGTLDVGTRLLFAHVHAYAARKTAEAALEVAEEVKAAVAALSTPKVDAADLAAALLADPAFAQALAAAAFQGAQRAERE